VEGGQKVIVGVNEYVMEEEPPEILRIGESVREWQTAKLARLRASRSNDAVERSLDALRSALALEPRSGHGRLSSANTMPYLLDCVRAYATLLAEELPCWRWAAFVSVLVQRRAELESRLYDNQLGYAAPSGERAPGSTEVGRFVLDRMDELLTLAGQMESFMLTPAFVGVFGEPGDEGSADADGILHAANRLMDYHERFLGLAERCRGLAAPSRYAGLLRDLAHLMDAPLAGYRTFINEFVERVGEMPELLHYGRGTVELDPVLLHIEADDKLLERISKQLEQIAAD